MITKDDPLAASKFLLNQEKIKGYARLEDSVKAFFEVRRTAWEGRHPQYLHLIEWAFPLPFMFKRTNGPILTTDDLKAIGRSNVGHDYFSSCFWHVYDWLSEGSAEDWTKQHNDDLIRIVTSTTLVWDKDRGMEMVEMIVAKLNASFQAATVPESVIDAYYTAAGRMRMHSP
jgi:hypothetical protein